MTAIGFIIQPGQPIPDDVTEVLDCTDDRLVLNRLGHWHASEAANPATCYADGPCSLDPGDYAPLTVTAVREQPAEPGCPKCRTIRNAKAASCDDPWHYDNRPAAPESDVLDLVRQYGDAHGRMMLLGDRGLPAESGVLAGRAAELLARIEAEVQRLRAEHEKCGQAITLAQNSRNHWLGRHEETLAELERLKAAQPDPRVLSLPQGTVALLGGKTQQRYACNDFPYRWTREDGSYLGLGEVFADEGSVTVVMREPRTWPKLDRAPEDLKAVRGVSGRIYKRNVHTPTFEAGMVSLSHLQELDGPLVEVFDDEDGTR